MLQAADRCPRLGPGAWAGFGGCPIADFGATFLRAQNMPRHVLARTEREAGALAKPAIVPSIGGRVRMAGLAYGLVVA
ncbi:hypothetical protein M2281_004896 [Mesorhizobium soli]|uniref:hypothetical protein n=1 Tax=Pseudaminobacter soli (ex Li et al. 2025) TaxID=1295366 RepID=UPI002476D659|nr:hypothetical protein [Mesorhizobium soli]MDH6234282.1 hypothetical protein [Mesorhizobium soli]